MPWWKSDGAKPVFASTGKEAAYEAGVILARKKFGTTGTARVGKRTSTEADGANQTFEITLYKPAKLGAAEVGISITLEVRRTGPAR